MGRNNSKVKFIFDARLLAWALILFCFPLDAKSEGFWDWLKSEPKNYDECILQNMTGKEGREAALIIRNSCRNLFPLELFGEPVGPAYESYNPLVPNLIVLSSSWERNISGQEVLRVILRAPNKFFLFAPNRLCDRIRFYYERREGDTCGHSKHEDLIQGPDGQVVSGTPSQGQKFVVDFVRSQIAVNGNFCYQVFCMARD